MNTHFSRPPSPRVQGPIEELRRFSSALTPQDCLDLRGLLTGRSEHFEIVTDLAHGKLEVKRGELGTYECQLTLKDVGVGPGATRTKMERLIGEINDRFRSLFQPESWCDLSLTNRETLPTGRGGDLVVRFTPLLSDSVSRRIREPLVESGSKERVSQRELLKTHSLGAVSSDLLLVSAGMFRLGKGFPENVRDLCSERDHGDLFEGMVVRHPWSEIAVGWEYDGRLLAYPSGRKANEIVGIAGRYRDKTI